MEHADTRRRLLAVAAATLPATNASHRLSRRPLPMPVFPVSAMPKYFFLPPPLFHALLFTFTYAAVNRSPLMPLFVKDYQR